MINAIRSRCRQGSHTIKYPAGDAPQLPERFLGLPVIEPSDCSADCISVCPTDAIRLDSASGQLSLDAGRCTFCGLCAAICPAITFSRNHALAASRRADLVIACGSAAPAVNSPAAIRKMFGRSLKLRQVSAGGCNACELDTNVLNTIGWDLSRFGIQFVASPRHADGLLVTGPVSKNMEEALLKTYQALPEPKIVIATGSCAISGGPYRGHPETLSGIDDILPVDLYIPGCPPHPLTILDGLLRLVGRINK